MPVLFPSLPKKIVSVFMIGDGIYSSRSIQEAKKTSRRETNTRTGMRNFEVVIVFVVGGWWLWW